MIDLNKLAAEIHAAAVEKGFWDVEDAEAKHIAKMHSELSEAVQADRVGNMYEVEREGAKPEGVVAELADFVMMVLDLAKHRELQIPNLHGSYTSPGDMFKIHAPLYDLVNSLHAILVFISDDKLFRMIYCTEIWLAHRGYDLWQIIRAKMEYNKSRPKLHGRAY